MKVDIRIPEGYPDSIPGILLDSADLSRDNLTTIRQEADKVTKQYIGDPMLLVVLNCIQEKFDEAVIIIKCDDSIKESHQSVDVWNTLLKLDHMRAKSKYIKTIEKWTQELNLKGRVVFCGKLILIVLQGSHANIKVRFLLVCLSLSEYLNDFQVLQQNLNCTCTYYYAWDWNRGIIK